MSIKDFNKPRPDSPYDQGYFKPQNPIKYISRDKRIIYRSSLEKKFCETCDKDPNILEWGSEMIRIPYTFKDFNAKTGQIQVKTLGYYPDYIIKVLTKSGEKKKYLVEVKAAAFLKCPPNISKNASRKTKISYIKKKRIYLQNKAKAIAAQEWCKKQSHEINYIFLTEKFFSGI